MRRFIAFLRPPAQENGNVALLFALLVIPVLGLVGLSVDSIRLFQTRQDLYQALEIALHAGLTAQTPEDATARARQYFEANWRAGKHDIPQDGSLSVSISSKEGSPDNSIVVAVARYRMPTIFMRLLGLGPVTVSATVEADYAKIRQRQHQRR